MAAKTAAVVAPAYRRSSCQPRARFMMIEVLSQSEMLGGGPLVSTTIERRTNDDLGFEDTT